jgi:DNA polymerase-3 subunit alpha
MSDFLHLHCHSQYSLLDGASPISDMMDKALQDGQLGVAITDHGNMFGAFKFVSEAKKRKIKPIIGCEFYLVKDRHRRAFSRAKGEQDDRYHQLLLAKNKIGYENLSKLCSLGFIEGLYGKFPRIDKELLLQYHEGLIATSCCIGAEIPQAILKGNLEDAEVKLKWWIDLFGEDFYIEIQRHRGMENIDGTGVSQEAVNQVLLSFAKKYNLKVIATNDSHYINEEDYLPHDILLCINTNSFISDIDRFQFPSSDFYFKTKAEMQTLFKDVPYSLENTMEVFEKVDTLDLARDVLLPAFPMPPEFTDQDSYLRYLTYEGAKKRYPELSAALCERIDFELKVIQNSGYPGYFLIVQDFTSAARKMNVAVGPGRGSAAGSVVAYCTGITNIDPIKYDLLFERFLNPERVSLPDIDIDFDDEGRQKVLDYVIDKYGKNKVAQIVTYGTMAAKLSLRDVGRVMQIPLPEVDKVTKTFPNALNATLSKVLEEKDINAKLKDDLRNEEVEKAYQFRDLSKGDDAIGKMIRTAKRLEGSVRNTGIHACGVVITPDEITKYVPVKVDKDSGMLVTQFDNSVAESAGLLKMDFLGLKTLTIIKNAVKMVTLNHGIDLDMDSISLTDEKTFRLFQNGETVGIFQYESPGMQKYLKELVPTTFEDLIAMNALYRPGPLSYIPNFINRKHGREKITYDLPIMEEILKDTYGITVYQEQVMLLSQKLAAFTKGEADVLRKAMGKKQKSVLDTMLPKFLIGGKENGHPEEVLLKIWSDWEAFASYAFNKSHSTCYAFVAFQTAYLKAHFPAEFMAAVLTNNKGNISDVTFFLQECRRMSQPVLGPNINESGADFTANKNGAVRFGLVALKGVGEGPVEEILNARAKEGPFTDFFDFMRRMTSQSVGKRVVESLVLSGAFDECNEAFRSQYFAPSDKYESLIEHATRYGQAVRQGAAGGGLSLFSDTEEIMIPEPVFPPVADWNLLEKLRREEEVTGFFISGHPLDDYHYEIKQFTTCSLDSLANHQQRPFVLLAGLVSKVTHKVSKNGNGWGVFEVSDFSGMFEFRLFGTEYQQFKFLLDEGMTVFLKGKFQTGWRDQGMEFKLLEVTLLEDVSAKLTKNVTLRIPLDGINTTLINDLELLINKEKGAHTVKIDVFDRSTKSKVSFSMRDKKIHANTHLIRKLEKMGIDCILNIT